MSEMVERLARAISPEVPTCCGAFCVFTPLSECMCGKIAALALAAMREPTTGMLKAGCLAYETAGQGFLIGAWRAMINAALAD